MTTPGILRLLFVLVLLSAGALLPRTANAAVSCDASASSMDFGTVDPQQAAATTTNGSISFNCRNDAFLQTVYVTMCLNIGAGSGGTTSPWRKMNDGAGHNLLFQLYRDAGHSQIWGSKLTPATPTPLQLKFTIPGAFLGDGTYSSASYPVYGLIPGNQGAATAGVYLNNFAGDSAAVSGTYNTGFGGYPADCGNGPAGSFPFIVSATVKPTCTVSTTELNFGNVAGLLSSGNHDGQSAISLKCVSGTQYKIGLDNGQHANGNTRRMQGPGGLIRYELYRNGGRTQRWGNTPTTDTVNGTADGNAHNTTVYGRVPIQATPAAGDYSDTITVTVTY